MAKQIVKFLKTHGRYVRGDVAGFDQATIASWPKGICKPFNPDDVDQPASGDVGMLDAMAHLVAKGAELDATAAKLEAMAAELEAREAALSMQGAASPVDAAKPSGEPQMQGEASPGGAVKPSGEPPKQGAKS